MSKSGAVGRFFGSLVSFFTRAALSLLQYIALLVSLGVTVVTLAEYTHRAIKERKAVVDIVYWRDPKKSAGVLAVILAVLGLFTRCSLISLVAYTALATLAAAIGFRAFKLAEAQIKKTDGANPFKHYLEHEVELPQERIHSQVDIFIDNAQALAKHLRHLFLVENLFDSIKFGLLLYTLTYVGAWFSGFTLVVLFVLAVFSVPKLYEVYQESIDKYIRIGRDHLESAQHAVEDKLPFVKKLLESGGGEKKKEQ